MPNKDGKQVDELYYQIWFRLGLFHAEIYVGFGLYGPYEAFLSIIYKYNFYNYLKSVDKEKRQIYILGDYIIQSW